MPHAELNILDIFPIYVERVLSFILQFFMFDSYVHDRGLHLSIVIMTLLFSYQFKSFISILVILSLCWDCFT